MIGNLVFSKTNVKHNKSTFYYVSSIFIIIMYLIFFNANSILPDNSTIMNSSIGKQIDVGSTKFSINRWEYNKNKKFMEIELSYKDSSDYITTKFDFSAKARVNVKKQLDVKTMLNTDNIYIVQIENIPDNYEAIALKVNQNLDSNSDINIDTSNISMDDFSSNTTDESIKDDNDNAIKNNATTLYCDYRKVKINNNLKNRTEEDYIINILKTEIKNINNNVIKINNKIKSNENMINIANEKINSLNSQLKYEIEAEQNKTNQKINNYKTKIDATGIENASIKITKAALIEKIAKVEQKINDIKKSEKIRKTAKEEQDKLNMKADKARIKSDNILLRLQKTREIQREQLNQIQLKHNTEIKEYKDNYNLFLVAVEKEKHIQEVEKNKLVIQNKKKAVEKSLKKAPKKAPKK